MKTLVLSLFFASGLTLSAQAPANHVDPTTNTGIHVGAMAVPMGSVNQANGDLSLAIPLISLPGKAGSGVSLALMYDSKSWTPHVTDQENEDLFIVWQYEQWRWPVGVWGWHLNLPSIEQPTDAFYSDSGSDAGHYILTLSDGTKHTISAAQSGLSSEDGEAIRVDFQTPAAPCSGCLIATLKDGTRMEFLNSNGRVSKITDRNGNATTITDTNSTSVTITDAAGHQLVLSRTGNYASSSYTGISYQDTTGVTQTINFDISTLNLFSTSSGSSYYVPTPAFAHPVQTGNTCGLCLNGHVWVSGVPSNQDTLMLTGIHYSGDVNSNYSFEYNGYGEITKVKYPTGGYARYEYSRYLINGPLYEAMRSDQDFREVTLQALCANTTGSCSSAEEMVSTFTPTVGATANTGLVQADAVGKSEAHDTTISLWDSSLGNPQEIFRQVLDYNGSPLQQITTEYIGINNDVALPSKVTTWLCSGSSSITTTVSMSYDSAPLHVMAPYGHVSDFQTMQTVSEVVGQVTLKKVYDYITSPACTATAISNTGALLRQETTSYLSSDSNYGTLSTAHISALPSQQQTLSGTGNILVQTSFFYDENASSYHGNLTSSITSGGSGASYASTTVRMTYNGWGGLLSEQNPRSATTSFTYGSDGNYPYPTIVEHPQTGSVHHFDYYSYDANTGLTTAHVDQNGSSISDSAHKTSYTYDSMLRVHYTDYPPTGSNGEVGRNTVEYTPTKTDRYIRRSATDVDLHSAVLLDGLGRQVQTQQLNVPAPCTGGVAYTDTSYDPLGRPWKVSTPYCSTSDSTYGLTAFAYDGLGRTLLQCHPDNGNNTSCVAGNDYLQWSYAGNVVTFYDEARNTGYRTTDALGRLTNVVEPGSNQTDYSYDVLGNLLNVTQPGASGETPRVRSFTYDSLSRVLTSSNPETGTLCYGVWNGGSCINGYDGNGNLVAKTDARGITTSFVYDALDRVTQKTYSDSTPAAYYTYDNFTGWGQPHGASIGRLVRSVITGPSGTEDDMYSYDAMGWINHIEGATPSEAGHAAHWMQMQYDLTGNLTTLLYPSGRIVKQGFDSAGRLNSVNYAAQSTPYGDINGGTPINTPYISSISYLPNGSPRTINYGNGVKEQLSLNSRLQTCESNALLAPALGGTMVFDRQYHFSPSAGTLCGNESGNNGNIYSVVDATNSNQGSGQRSQSFTYDYLNRVKTWNTSLMADLPRSQTFNYDSFGNLTQSNGTNMPNFAPTDPFVNNRLPASSFGCVASPNATAVDPSNPGYDLAGNVLCSDAQGYNAKAYVYDAESRVSQFQHQVMNNTYIPAAAYTYDAQGSRIRKDQGSFGSSQYTEYVWANGQVLSEKDQTGTWIDYIYANGKKVAKVAPPVVLHHSGVCGGCSNDASNFAIPALASNLGSYVLRSGDKLVFQQMQNNARAGLYLIAGDNSNSMMTLFDANGDTVNASTIADGAFHTRVVDLSSWANKTISTNLGVSVESNTPSGVPWDSWITDIAIVSADGSVHTMMNGNMVSGAQSNASSGSNLTVGPVGSAVQQVTVRFTNDSCSACSGTAPNQDRNLYISSVSVGSTTLSASDSSVTCTNCSTPGSLLGNGNPGDSGDMTFPFPSSPSGAVTVTAYGSPDYGLYPHMQVFINGLLAGEWDVAGTARGYTVGSSIPSAAHYYVGDNLGTTQMEFTAAGWPVWKGEFSPFGQELDTQPTDNHYKFTGHEHDNESGLDNFGVRYYGSSMGRFMSPDSSGYSGLTNPQSWNLYSYTLNNPLKFIDPSGHSVESVCTDNKTCVKAVAEATGNAEAASRVTSTTTTTNHSFLGLHWTTSKTTIGFSGDEASFRALSTNASHLADLVESKENFTVDIRDQGYFRKDRQGWAGTNANTTNNLAPFAGGFTQGPSLTGNPDGNVYIKWNPGPDDVANEAGYEHIPGVNRGEAMAHELLGHLWGEVFGGHANGIAANKQDAVNAENAVRATDPTRGQKAQHDHYH